MNRITLEGELVSSPHLLDSPGPNQSVLLDLELETPSEPKLSCPWPPRRQIHRIFILNPSYQELALELGDKLRVVGWMYYPLPSQPDMARIIAVEVTRL